MVEVSDGVLIIKDSVRYQQGKKREKTKIRVQRLRERRRNADVTQNVTLCNAKCNADVTQNVTLDVTHPNEPDVNDNINNNEGKKEDSTQSNADVTQNVTLCNAKCNADVTQNVTLNVTLKTKEEKRKEKEPKSKEEKNENKNSKHTHQNCACTRVDEGQPAKNPEESAAGRPSFEEVRAEFERRGAEDPNGEAEAFFDYNDTREKWTYWKKTVSLWMHRVKFKKAETPNISKSSFDAAEFFDAAVKQTYRQEKGGS
nr:MAG TPA: hypothetical protein [Caudoviricetes sp.]